MNDLQVLEAKELQGIETSKAAQAVHEAVRVLEIAAR